MTSPVYTHIKNGAGDILSIRRGNDEYIPVHPRNLEYQQYLADVTAGSVPLVETIPDPIEPVSDHDLLMALAEIVEGMI